MSEKTRFYNMTKPVRFRRLKQAKMMIVLWCKALRERIIYFFNYILYKLHILKRYSYRDNVVQAIPLPYSINPKEVITDHFRGVVSMSLMQDKYIDLDYFYREKKGDKKVTLYLKNEEKTRLYLESHLTDIGIRVKNWYSVNSLPVFKVSVLDPEVKPFTVEKTLEPMDYQTVTYNTSYLKNLTHKSIVGVDMNVEDISEAMVKYYYDYAVDEFKKHLNNISLQDLIMQEDIMKPERLNAILAKVQEKYVGQRLSYFTVECLYRDLSAVMRGLHKTEHFLNFTANCQSKVILVKDEETLNYLGLMPYLDNRLMAKCEDPYLVYLLKGNEAYTQCAVRFIDLYNGSETDSYLGFDVEVFPIIPLGVYYPDTNDFREWRKE